jgi:hypothetical protein
MKNTLWLGMLAVSLGLSPLTVRAGDCGSCCAAPAPCASCETRLQLTIIPEKYTECVPCKTTEVIKAVSRSVERDVVRCRSVPVCTTDPCTGHTCTTYKEESYVEKVKATVIDFVKEEVVTPAKTVEKVRNTYVISICHDVTPAPCAVPAPPAPAAMPK